MTAISMPVPFYYPHPTLEKALPAQVPAFDAAGGLAIP